LEVPEDIFRIIESMWFFWFFVILFM
jgi:hypothetical protein